MPIRAKPPLLSKHIFHPSTASIISCLPSRKFSEGSVDGTVHEREPGRRVAVERRCQAATVQHVRAFLDSGLLTLLPARARPPFLYQHETSTMKLAIFASLLAATSAFVPSAGPSMGRAPSTLLRAEESDFKGAEAISGLTKDVETVFTVEDIAAAIPHRYPFALVDKVIEYEAGKRAVGVKSITNNEPQFTGHFPGKPIFPGVMQVEALAQLAGVVALKMDGVEEGSLFLFGGVDGVKWKKPVVPGDQLVMEVEITKFNAKFGLAKATGKAYVDGQLACEVGQM